MFAEKEKKRGYNQAAIIANGISESFGVPVLNNIVNRSKATSSQTNKHRIERWQNVEDSFQIHQLDCLENKHFLLVDDVLTTGATLEACGISILQNPQVTLSIATLAMAGT
jgi:predicted amidophosphoribosyltransferase